MASSSAPEILQLLADPLRWELMSELGRSDRRVNELVELTAKPQNVVSYHLRELREAGIVTSRRSAADGRDVYYRADLLRCRDLLAGAGAALHPSVATAPLDPTRQRGHAPRVLFLCTGNSARSQMAEALVEHRSGGTIEARSAGSHPKTLHPLAVRVMAERGIDISGRNAKPLSRFARHRFDRVITLCDKVREICPEFTGAPTMAHWSMPDPAAEGRTERDRLAAFTRAANDIDERVTALLADLQTNQPERN